MAPLFLLGANKDISVYNIVGIDVFLVWHIIKGTK